MSSVHRYRISALAPHYLGSTFGIAVTGVICFSNKSDSPAFWVGFMLAVLVSWHFAAIVMRHWSVIEVSEEGVQSRGIVTKTLPWRMLTDVVLDYYPLGMDGRSGWMQLKLAGAGVRIFVLSWIDNFDDIVRTVAKVSECRDLALTAASLANMKALGVTGARRSHPT